MLDFDNWMSKTEDKLAEHEIAIVNLCAAIGLPGWDEMNLSIDKLCRKVDEWAAVVEHGTERSVKQRKQHRDLTTLSIEFW